MSGVQSVDRAFALLRCLAGGPAGVSDLAARVDLPKSTVSRLLATLVDLGAVEQVSPGGEYSVGDLIPEIAQGARPMRSLVVLAHRHLAELADAIGEAVGLGVPEGRQVRYLDQVSTDSSVQVRDWTGEVLDAHASSSGYVFGAFDPEIRSQILSGPFHRHTPSTVTDPALLAQRFERCAARGFEWTYGEFAVDLNSVAAPVRDHRGVVIAAVHAFGPSYRFPGHRADQIAAAVVATAERISHRLGAADDR